MNRDEAIRMDDMRSYLSPELVDCVVYHKDCSDGFAAAYCIWKYWSEKGIDNDTIESNIQFIEYSHLYSDAEVKEGIYPLIQGKHVLYLDVCPRESLFLDMVVNLPEKAIVIDHHESSYTATKNVNGFVTGQHCYFDMSHSGCVLAHMYVFPERPIPLFLQCIEDRDIWCWKIPAISKPFVEAFYVSVPFEFDEYHKYDNEDNVLELAKEGATLRRFKAYRVADLVQRAHEATVSIAGTAYNVFIINTMEHVSELGEALSQTPFKGESRSDKLCDFAVLWYYNHHRKQIVVSLRSDTSRDTSANVRQIAEKFGGGGHRGAAGFHKDGNDSIMSILNGGTSSGETARSNWYASYVRETVTAYWWVVPVVGLFFVCGKLNS